MEQKQNEKNKLYSLHAPVVEFIVMGKVHRRNEFGVKVKIAMTNRSNFVVVRMVSPDNPYDSHALKRVLEKTCRLSQKQIDQVFVDRDYRRNGESISRNYISGQKRGITTRRLERSLRRRQAVELGYWSPEERQLTGSQPYEGMLGGSDKCSVVLCHSQPALSIKASCFCCPEYLAQFSQWMQCLWSLDRRIEEFEAGRKCIDDGSMELLPLQQAPTAA